MRTIDNIREYNLTNNQIIEFKRIWVINWCWWKWWFDFSVICNKIAKLKYFDEKKINKLYDDILILCYEHDIQFFVWNSFISFLKANYKFSIWLVALTHWTVVVERIMIFFTIFTLLSTIWIQYFNFWKKRDYVLYQIKLNK